MKYRPNNIRFRIASARAFQQYKTTQASVLTEVLGQKHHFPRVAREILLLGFDRWFSLLVRVESDFLDSETVTQELVEHVLSEFAETVESIDTVTEDFPELFQSHFTQVWRECYTDVLTLIRRQIEGLVGECRDSAIMQLGYILSMAQQHSLYILHEINQFERAKKKKHPPFISADDLVIKSIKDFNEDILLSRINCYRREFEDFATVREWIVKDYTSGVVDITPCLKSLESAKVIVTEIV